MKKDRIVLFLLAAAFATLAVELKYFHAGIWQQKPVAWIPVVTTVLAFLACLVGMAADKKLSKFLGWVLVVCSLSGLGGVYFHTEGDFKKVEKVISSNYRQDFAEKMMKEDLTPDRPLLAPLSLTGLCVLGAVVLLGRKGS
ncbi:hypothetical protein QPK87_05850 [Kamptonema cortianum]|nr:hypothetical protein [Geitlerinema splendidum]MDK3156097.1 hypothetical protein [Kamptonema cortianum]